MFNLLYPLSCRLSVPGFFLILLFSCGTEAACETFASDYHAGAQLEAEDSYMGIRMLASLRLQKVSCKSLPLSGLSALAWSPDTGILYAVSDRGHILHLQPVFSDGILRDINIVDAFPLRGSEGKTLGITAGDSEGMTLLNGNNGIVGDEELLISFERQPRISRYRPYGVWLADMAIADELMDVNNYRTPNQALESVVMHPRLGLLTAPERPLSDYPQEKFSIFNEAGVLMSIPRADKDYGSLTDMSLTADSNLLVLERIFSNVFGVIAAVIHHVDLENKEETVRTIVRFDRDDGHLIDNFEGLAHHYDNRYFLVSDDNDFPLQQILLFYFKLLE